MGRPRRLPGDPIEHHLTTLQWFDIIYRIVEELRPISPRGIWYQLVNKYDMPKTESWRKKVGTWSTQMRNEGRVPFEWISDSSRWVRRPSMFDSPQQAVDYLAQLYRRNIWRDMDCQVFIMVEKDGLAPVIEPVTAAFGVALYALKGFSSLTYETAMVKSVIAAAESGKPTYCYHLGDFDPSGWSAFTAVRRKVRERSGIDVPFMRLALTPEQIIDNEYPCREMKNSDPRAKQFQRLFGRRYPQLCDDHGQIRCCELDAVSPIDLRRLVQCAIEKHMPQELLQELLRREEQDRWQLRLLARQLPEDDAEDEDEVLPSPTPRRPIFFPPKEPEPPSRPSPPHRTRPIFQAPRPRRPIFFPPKD